MFRDRRDFRAIAFTIPNLNSIAGIRELLPKDSISEGKLLKNGSPKFQIEHLYYYSKERYSPSPELDSIKQVWHGIEQYRYDLYLLGFNGPNSYIAIVAVPLLKMGMELFNQVHEKVIGRGLVYQKVLLEKLLKAVRDGHHLGGYIKITNIQMLIKGDPPANSVLIAGDDALNSKTFELLHSSLSGIEFNPMSCRIIYDEPGERKFYLGVDKFGNYSFYVRVGGHNLHWANYLLTYLYGEKLIGETIAKPWRLDKETIGVENV
jgi:hypothetical protein